MDNNNKTIFKQLSDSQLRLCNIAFQALIYTNYSSKDSMILDMQEELAIEDMQVAIVQEQEARGIIHRKGGDCK